MTDNAPTSSTVLIERDGAVAVVTLNRPDALNSLTTEMKEALRDGLAELATDPDIRAVVLTANGRAFCAGQDLVEHLDALKGDDPPLGTVAEHYNPIVESLAGMPKPTIAAVNGMAAGAGASFAYACDFRIAGESAKFLLAFANIGLSVDSGASYHLPRLIGQSRALEMMLLAKPVDAARSLEIGMVNEVVADDAVRSRAVELAQQLAGGATLAYGLIKDAVRYSATHDLHDSLANEGELMHRAGESEDHRGAVAAFVAKEKPTFSGR